jgi:hypothetical protein
MIGAGDDGFQNAPTLEQAVRAMLADIVEAPQDIITAPNKGDFLSADARCEVTAGFGHIAAVTHDEPCATEERPHLDLEAASVGVPGAGWGMAQRDLSTAQAAAALCQSATVSSKVKS